MWNEFFAAQAELADRRLVTPGGKAERRSTKAAEARTRWPVSRQACCIRATVFIVSPRNAISILTMPSSPMTTGPQCSAARKLARQPKSRM